MNPLCLLRTWWWSLRIGASVSGCNYVEDVPETLAYVHVLRCRCCGRINVGWRPR
jgi:hypothetical protein